MSEAINTLDRTGEAQDACQNVQISELKVKLQNLMEGVNQDSGVMSDVDKEKAKSNIRVMQTHLLHLTGNAQKLQVLLGTMRGKVEGTIGQMADMISQ